MLRKLYALVSGSCSADNPDSPQLQEVLLPGYLYGMIIKERLEEALNQVRNQIATDVRRAEPPPDFLDSGLLLHTHCPKFTTGTERYITKVIQKVNWDIGSRMSNFLATGNLISPSGLDLQQASGFTIVAEKLNWSRYISHFRSIHRGAFFAELKTTTVRKLLPEAWGKLVFPGTSARVQIIILTRLSLSRSHTRRFALWPSEPPLPDLSHHHYPSRRRSHSRASGRSWHDPTFLILGRRSQKPLRSARWSCYRVGTTGRCKTARREPENMENRGNPQGSTRS